MSLIKNQETNAFDTDAIGKGMLMYAKHKKWDEGKAGIITAVTDEKIFVEFIPNIGNIINHYLIDVAEVVNDEWVIRWSEDLTEVNEYEA